MERSKNFSINRRTDITTCAEVGIKFASNNLEVNLL